MQKGKLELARAMTNVGLARTFDDVLAGILWGEMVEHLKKVEAGEEETIPENMLSLLAQSDVSYNDATMRMKLERYKDMVQTIIEKEKRIIELDGKLTVANENVLRLEKEIVELKEALREKNEQPNKKPEKKDKKKSKDESGTKDMPDKIAMTGRERLLAALERNNWKLGWTALDLRMTTSKLKKLMAEFGVEKPK